MATSTIRVAHVLYSLHRGGMEAGLAKVVNALGPPGFHHDVIALTEIGEGAREIRPGAATLHALHKRAGNDPRTTLRLLLLLRRLSPHVLRTYSWAAWADGVVTRLLLRIPVHVHSEHGKYHYETPAQRRRRLAAQRILAAMTDRVVAVSNDIARSLAASGVSRSRIRVIPNGVDTERFAPPTPAERLAARTALDVPDGTFVVGSVGRLVPEKSYHTLIEAIAGLPSPDVLVAIVGEGPERARLEASARDVGVERRVRLLGERSDVPLLLKGMDLFVLPSVSEGMSNTILEAMASGLPVISTPVGGTREILRSADDGLLVPPGQARALGAALRELHGSEPERRRLADAALERVRRHFSITVMTRSHAMLLGPGGGCVPLGRLSSQKYAE